MVDILQVGITGSITNRYYTTSEYYLEFKSPVQSSFFAFFGRGLDWTALGSLGMVHGPLKDQSKVVSTSFQKDWSKTTKKPVQTTKNLVFLHFIDVFHIKGMSDSI